MNSSASRVDAADDEPGAPTPAAHYETALLNELCKFLLSAPATDAELRRPVQFISRIEGVDNFVNAAVAVDPENSAFRLPLSTRLVSPLHGPASGLWRVYGVLHGGAAPSVEVFLAVFIGDADYRTFVAILDIRRRVLQATGFTPP